MESAVLQFRPLRHSSRDQHIFKIKLAIKKLALMKTWCVTAVLLLCVGISVGRQLQQGYTPSSGGNTATAQATATATASTGGGQIYAIDPWSLGRRCVIQ